MMQVWCQITADYVQGYVISSNKFVARKAYAVRTLSFSSEQSTAG